MSEFPLYPNAPTMVKIDQDELTRLREENRRQAARISELEKDLGEWRTGPWQPKIWLDELRTKLAAFESQLAEVRAERPEVEEIRSRYANDFQDLRDYPELLVDPINAWIDVANFQKLIAVIDDLQRTEAAWRSARGCWIVTEKTLRDEIDRQRAKVAYAETGSAKCVNDWREACEAAEARVRALSDTIAELKQNCDGLRCENEQYHAANLSLSKSITELQAKCERLEAALRDAHDWIQGFANGASRPHMDGRKVLANAKKVLAAADGVKGGSHD